MDHIGEDVPQTLAFVDVGFHFNLCLLLASVFEAFANRFQLFLFLDALELQLFQLFLK